jgi:hypothetical protein
MKFYFYIICLFLISCNQDRNYNSVNNSSTEINSEPDVSGKMIGQWKFQKQIRHQVDSNIKLPKEYLENLPVKSSLVKLTDTIISIEMTPDHKFKYVSRGDTTEYYYTVYSNEINLHVSDYIEQLDFEVRDSILTLYQRRGIFWYEIRFLKQ